MEQKPLNINIANLALDLTNYNCDNNQPNKNLDEVQLKQYINSLCIQEKQLKKYLIGLTLKLDLDKFKKVSNFSLIIQYLNERAFRIKHLDLTLDNFQFDVQNIVTKSFFQTLQSMLNLQSISLDLIKSIQPNENIINTLNDFENIIVQLQNLTKIQLKINVQLAKEREPFILQKLNQLSLLQEITLIFNDVNHCSNQSINLGLWLVKNNLEKYCNIVNLVYLELKMHSLDNQQWIISDICQNISIFKQLHTLKLEFNENGKLHTDNIFCPIEKECEIFSQFFNFLPKSLQYLEVIRKLQKFCYSTEVFYSKLIENFAQLDNIPYFKFCYQFYFSQKLPTKKTSQNFLANNQLNTDQLFFENIETSFISYDYSKCLQLKINFKNTILFKNIDILQYQNKIRIIYLQLINNYLKEIKSIRLGILTHDFSENPSNQNVMLINFDQFVSQVITLSKLPQLKEIRIELLQQQIQSSQLITLINSILQNNSISVMELNIKYTQVAREIKQIASIYKNIRNSFSLNVKKFQLFSNLIYKHVNFFHLDFHIPKKCFEIENFFNYNFLRQRYRAGIIGLCILQNMSHFSMIDQKICKDLIKQFAKIII